MDCLAFLNTSYKYNVLDVAGYEKTSEINTENHVYLGDVISALKLDKPVIVCPSMSGGYSIPYLFNGIFFSFFPPQFSKF